MLRDRLERVRERIRLACERSGRQPSTVTLVGVTKTVPSQIIRDAAALGLADIGENRVQEAQAKQAALAGTPVRWHLIGHLQRNKAKPAVELFDVVHSLDSAELADALDRHAAGRRKVLHVLIQVNVSGEAGKSGCAPDEALALAQHLRGLPHLQWRGLMTIPPLADDPEAARPHFRRLKHLRDELARRTGAAAGGLHLSMGMSHDFEIAIEEGADIVRVGTAIFGERP